MLEMYFSVVVVVVVVVVAGVFVCCFSCHSPYICNQRLSYEMMSLHMWYMYKYTTSS